MASDPPQPSLVSQTDALDSILFIAEGREDTTVRPTRLKHWLESYPCLPEKVPPAKPPDAKAE